MSRLEHTNDLNDLFARGEHAAEWYEKAASEIDVYSARCGYEANDVAAIIAILSPRVQVKRNARLAVQFIETGSVDGIMRSRVDAITRYFAYGKLTGETHGHKVYAFYRNLSGDFDHVTVDVWMSRLYGVEFDTITDEQRREIQEDVETIAERTGYTPAAVQAILWVGYRSQCGHIDADGHLSILDEVGAIV
jgi:hypothetical protein